MAFLDLIAQLRRARSELAEHNIRVAEADLKGDWNTKDDLRESGYEYAAAVIEEVDKIVDLLHRVITWPAWLDYLTAALDHAETMPDDATPVSLAQIVDDVDTARTEGEAGPSPSGERDDGGEVTDLPTDAEFVVINSLKDRGYAVVVFTPQEMRGADTGHVEDRLVELGWDVIDVLADDGVPAAS